ncbi:MAG: DUF2282 domain-containing protein [Alphaproteobacteria bacterium]
MTKAKTSALALAALASGAFAAATFVAPAQAETVKCYGIAKAGENDCANVAGTHSCAGQSTVDYSFDEWKTAEQGDCLAMGGSLEGGDGINEKMIES